MVVANAVQVTIHSNPKLGLTQSGDCLIFRRAKHTLVPSPQLPSFMPFQQPFSASVP